MEDSRMKEISEMKFTGKLKQPIIDFRSGKLTLLFEPNEDFRETYEELKDCDKLSLEIKKYRAKRSLDANAYLWVLLDKLSDKIGAPRMELYIQALKDYGTFEYVPLRKKDIHLAQAYYRIVIDRRTEKVKDINGNEEELHLLQCYKGSSKYDTKEMSRLIKGVFDDCRQVGIPEADLLTPDEILELKERWGVDIG